MPDTVVMDSQPPDLESEQNRLVDDYLRLRNDKKTAEDPRKIDRELNKVLRQLDGLYWKRVSELATRQVARGRESLDFTDDERLLIDMGLLDVRLIEGADTSLSEQLLEEMRRPGAVNHYYFSEWLEDRYRRQILTAQMEAQEEIEAAQKDSELAGLVDSRNQLWKTLTPLMDGLPGVTPVIAQNMMSGLLDDQVQAMGIYLLERPRRQDFVRRHRLRLLRRSVLAKLHNRVENEKDYKRLAALEELYRKVWGQRYAAYKEKGLDSLGGEDLRGAQEAATLAKMLEFIDGEIKFAKSLLPLGALAGGIARVSSIMVDKRERIVKPHIQEEMERARECDRGFSATPVVLIAPFTGRGFFEWDRDSLVLPLFPVEGAADAIANATANYRMMIDSLQQNGHLKQSYEEAFQGANFQAGFQKDYRDWVCTVGHGRREEMSEENFRFFMEHIGPEHCGILGPANLRHLTSEARSALIRQLEKQTVDTQDANLLFRLGVLYWQEDRLDDALRQMARAITLNPQNGLGTFAMGLILKQSGRAEQSRQAFQVCTQRIPESIWAVYGRMAVEGTLS